MGGIHVEKATSLSPTEKSSSLLDTPNSFRHLVDRVARGEVGDVCDGCDVVEPHVDLEHHVKDATWNARMMASESGLDIYIYNNNNKRK